MGSSLGGVSSASAVEFWGGGGGWRRREDAPRAWHGLYDDVVVLDAALEEFLAAAGEETFDDRGVPARVYDADAQVAAVVGLGGAGAFGWGWGGHDGWGCEVERLLIGVKVGCEWCGIGVFVMCM